MCGTQRLGRLLAACLLGTAAACGAAPVVVGMTLPMSGPEAPFGLALRDGARLAIARANAAGGEPLAALVAPVASADSLREPVRPGVFHLRAGTAEQAFAALLHLDTLGIERYALLMQDDEPGRSALERLQLELTRIALRPIAVERLPATTTADELRGAMSRVCAAGPQALILALDPATAAPALAASRAQQCAQQHLVFSETGALLAARKPEGGAPHPFAGLLVTQVVPHPSRRLQPLADEFQRELATRSFELPGMKLKFGAAQRLARPFVEINLLDAEGRLRH